MPRKNRPLAWKPVVGGLAHYASRFSGLTRQGCPVRIIAEAVGARMVVEIIGYAGHPVRITVKTTNLQPMPPSLFDGTEYAL